MAVFSQPLPTAQLVRERAELMKQLQEIDAELQARGKPSDSLVA